MIRPVFLVLPVLVLATLVASPIRAGEPPAIDLPERRPVVGRTIAAAQPPTSTPISDEEALKRANLAPDDGGKLIEYLQQRTLTETEQGRIASIIKRFALDDFEEREKATEEIESFGSAAIGPLKAAARDGDPEVAYRARLALKRVETVPHSAVAAAAVRAVVKLKPDGAAAALIGFLPLADDDSVADVIRDALVSLAVGKDGKAEPALVAAIADVSPARRSAAYAALIQGGPSKERIRIKDAFPKVREAILKESDVDTKFHGLWLLTLTTREKEFIPELIALIPTLPRGRIWQLEDLLLQLAGTHPKGGRFLKSADSLGKTRDAWLAWWKEHGTSVDFAKSEFKPRVLGLTDIIEMDARFSGPGRIVSLGHDLKEKWRINNVQFPTDMRIAPNGNLFVVESNSNLITERAPNGDVVNRLNAYQQPVNINLLPGGGIFVVCRNNIFVFDKDRKQLATHPRNNYDVMTGHALPNGDSLIVTTTGQTESTVIRLDDKLKETGKKYTFGHIQNLQSMDVFGDERVLVCEWTKVAEYDLKSGKQVWSYNCNQPSSCQRLYNGNTLVSLMNHGATGRIIEVDPSGEVVWEFLGRDGLRAGRAYRR